MPDLLSIPASQIGTDYTYQRPLIRRHVAKLAREFDPEQIGPIVVSNRADGTYWVIDGQHRIAAMRAIGYDNPVDCLVYKGLTLDKEAKLFTAQAASKRIHPVHLYLAKVESGDPRYLAIDKLVTDAGFEITVARRAPDVLQSPVAVEHIYDRGGPDHLTYVLGLLAQVWEGSDTAPPAYILLGLHTLILKYRHLGIDTDRLVDVLRRTPMRDIHASAQLYATGYRERREQAYGRAMLGVYNQKLKDGHRRLPPWDGPVPSVAEDAKDERKQAV